MPFITKQREVSASAGLPQLDINDLDAIADFVCSWLDGCQSREQEAGNDFLSVKAARNAILAALTPSTAC